MLIEARAAGPRLRDARKQATARLEQRLETVLDRAFEDGLTLDIPATALLGGVRAIVLRHLRGYEQDELPSRAREILAWVSSYTVQGAGRRWSTGVHASLPAGVAAATPAREPPARRLPRGRHKLPAAVVARSQRNRVIDATAEVMMHKGYGESTVSDIVAAAGVARDVFYEHFANKQHAFLVAQQHGTQDIFETVAHAYFSAEAWPERVWKGLARLLTVIAERPAHAHLRLVECYAAGGEASGRAEEITRSFTVFLEEGYSQSRQAHSLPRISSAAITGAIFDIIQRRVAAGATVELSRDLPLLAYIAIAPFTGPAAAVQAIEKLRKRESRKPGVKARAAPSAGQSKAARRSP